MIGMFFDHQANSDEAGITPLVLQFSNAVTLNGVGRSNT